MRARNIKPGFFASGDLAEVDRTTRLLYIGLWCMADAKGRLKDRPKQIMGELFRFDDDVTTDVVDDALANLATLGFIERYEVDGVRYLEISAFLEHQTPHHRERVYCPDPPSASAQDQASEAKKPETRPRPAQPEPEASPGQALGQPEASPGQAQDLPPLFVDMLNDESCSLNDENNTRERARDSAVVPFRQPDDSSSSSSESRGWYGRLIDRGLNYRHCQPRKPKTREAYQRWDAAGVTLAEIDQAIEIALDQGTKIHDIVPGLLTAIVMRTIRKPAPPRRDNRPDPAAVRRDMERWLLERQSAGAIQ